MALAQELEDGSSEPLYYLEKGLAIEFTGFSIRNPDTGKVYFSRNTNCSDVGEVEPIPDIPPTNGICYLLPEDFLRATTIACQIIFRNTSDQSIEGVRLVEEHILQGEPLQNYDFDLIFVAPRTQNTWENIYSPEFKRGPKFEEQAKKGPWEIVTSLYVKERLVLRNRAQLKFV